MPASASGVAGGCASRRMRFGNRALTATMIELPDIDSASAQCSRCRSARRCARPWRTRLRRAWVRASGSLMPWPTIATRVGCAWESLGLWLAGLRIRLYGPHSRRFLVHGTTMDPQTGKNLTAPSRILDSTTNARPAHRVSKACARWAISKTNISGDTSSSTASSPMRPRSRWCEQWGTPSRANRTAS